MSKFDKAFLRVIEKGYTIEKKDGLLVIKNDLQFGTDRIKLEGSESLPQTARTMPSYPMYLLYNAIYR